MVKLKNVNSSYVENLPSVSPDSSLFSDSNIKYTILPGFCDVHVHFREPGFSYKETILTGSMAAARGGYTAVLTMPNLKPVPDSAENIKKQIDIIKKDGQIKIYPYASITVNEEGKTLSDMDGLAPFAVAFSDDGRGIQSEDMMRQAMIKAKSFDKIIAAHCEDNAYLNGGYIHNGEYCRTHGHKGISKESEYLPIKRDLKLAGEIGASYHICHISCKESVDLIRNAKKEGINVTCETAPHYLTLSDKDLQEDGRFKMNPPLRSEQDREALLEGLSDGTIDMIATDHAPHSKEEKAGGLQKSPFGIVGLETAFPILYTKLVKTDIISLDKLIDLLVYNPRKRFNIPIGNDYSVWDLEKSYQINPKEFLSKGKSTPFENETVLGRCLVTVSGGKIVYKENN